MKKVLAVLGSNFLGHITNVLPITDFLKQHSFDIDFVIVPLSKLENPPIVKFLTEKNIKFDYIDTFTSTKTPTNVFSYLDLLYMYEFANFEKTKNYYQFIKNTVLSKNYELVISDFTLFTSMVCKEYNIRFVAIRSHSLKVSNYQNKPIELFNWWSEIPEETKKMIDNVQDVFTNKMNIDSFERVLYGDITITPGFFPFDDLFPNYGKHFFVTEKNELKNNLPEKDVYLYVRDISKLDIILKTLSNHNKSYFIIDSNLNSQFINLWESIPNTKLLISHGGHGMCIWSISHKLFHLALPDNNDRLSNAKRLKEIGLGDYLLSLNNLDSYFTNFSYNEQTMNFNSANLIDNSISFDEFSNYLLTQIQ